MNLIQLLLIIAAGVILYRVVSALRGGDSKDEHRPTTPTANMRIDPADESGSESDDEPERYKRARAMWGHLSSDQPAPSRSTPPPPPTRAADAGDEARFGASDNTGFGGEEFLRGAKLVYVRIIEDAAQDDTDDALEFATENALKMVRNTLASSGEVEVLLTDAQIENVDQSEDRTRATVRFESMLRRSMSEGFGEDRVDTWTFERDERSDNANWMLVAAR
jgi:predicted lipid-binding transport protein (Tim44 family)